MRLLGLTRLSSPAAYGRARQTGGRLPALMRAGAWTVFRLPGSVISFGMVVLATAQVKTSTEAHVRITLCAVSIVSTSKHPVKTGLKHAQNDQFAQREWIFLREICSGRGEGVYLGTSGKKPERPSSR